MKAVSFLCLGLIVILCVSVWAQDSPRLAQPQLLFQQSVGGMPTMERQEIRLVTGVLEPGVTTGWHTHRYPLVVYVLEGEFTLEYEDKEPITLKAGEIAVEPARTRVVGYNRSTKVARILDFYVSEPNTPFVDPAP